MDFFGSFHQISHVSNNVYETQFLNKQKTTDKCPG